MKSIASKLSIIALGFGLLGCPGGGGGGGDSTSTLAVSTTAANFGVVGNVYTSTLAATGGTAPFTWMQFGGILPTGLVLDSGTGVVSGTPVAPAGNFNTTFTVTDSTGQTATGSVLFAIHPRTDLVSIDNSSPSLPGGAASSSPSISNDGRFVAFASSATLIPGVSGAQIYIHDWQTNQTSLVSQNAVGIAGDGTSSQPTISSNGQFVAFTSLATNLVATVSGTQIFLRDTQANTTSLVSQNAVGIAGDGASSQPTISSNGQFVAFTSTATNLALIPGASGTQIFLRDTQTPTTTLVSQNAVGNAGDGASSQPTISSNGQFVAFTSAASNLTGDPDPAPFQIFLRDTQLNITTLVSQATSGAVGDGTSSQPTISTDGSFVAFTSTATNLALIPGASGTQIYLRDTQTPTTTLVSQNAVGNAGDGASSQPTISSNGQFVAFTSLATNLVATVSGTQIFLRDTQANTTSLVSQNAVGIAGNGVSSQSTMSANGGFVAFSSLSTNLGALGGNQQIYVRALP